MVEEERQTYLRAGREAFYRHIGIRNYSFQHTLGFVNAVAEDNLPAGIDLDQLHYLIDTYRLPPMSAFFYTGSKNYLNPAVRRFAEFTLALKFTPRTGLQSLPLDYYGEISADLSNPNPTLAFEQLPQQHFLADRLFLASIVARNGQLLYPQLDNQRRIVAATEFSVTEAQRYFIERKAREVMAQKRQWRQLYPTRRGWGGVFNQQPNGRLSFSVGGYHGEYKNATLFFPVGEGVDTLNLALAEAGREEEAAHYDHSIKTIAFIEEALKRRMADTVRNRQDIKNIVLHEQNHLIFSHLSQADQNEVVDMFDSDDKLLLAFAQSLTNLHLDIAAKYLTDNPQAEALTIRYKGSELRVAKKPIIKELLACAAAESNTPRHLKAGLVGKERVLASRCIQALSGQNKQKLRDYHLVMDAGSAQFKQFFQAFEQALSILAPEYHPKSPLYEVGSNRFKRKAPTVTAILAILAISGASLYELTHDGIGLNFSDGKVINLRLYLHQRSASPTLRLELQNSGPIERNRPFYLSPDHPLYYPQLSHLYYLDFGLSGVSFDAMIREDFKRAP